VGGHYAYGLKNIITQMDMKYYVLIVIVLEGF